VEHFGGKISVESVEGEGTTFGFYIFAQKSSEEVHLSLLLSLSYPLYLLLCFIIAFSRSMSTTSPMALQTNRGRRGGRRLPR